jgi:hypothetical protein
VEKERVFELNKLILEQVNDLWLLAVALVVFQVLVISFVSAQAKAAQSDKRTFVVWALALSALAYAASLAFAAKGTWEFPKIAGVMGFFQLAALGIGLGLFVLTFLISPRFLARAVKETAGK